MFKYIFYPLLFTAFLPHVWSDTALMHEASPSELYFEKLFHGKSYSENARNFLEIFPDIDLIYTDLHKLSDMAGSKSSSRRKFSPYLNIPTYRGGLAYRERFSRHFAGKRWPDFRREIFGVNKKEIIAQDAAALSPAEKYDLLLGADGNFFDEEIFYSDRMHQMSSSMIPSWSGICHGSVLASFLERPILRGTWARTYDGGAVYFAREDLVKLLAHYWANKSYKTAYVGRRCFGLDSLDERDCLGLDPGAFHLSLVNYVGVYGETFIVDILADEKIFNVPVVAYDFDYFHLSDQFRSKDYAKVLRRSNVNSTLEVGVVMRVSYLFPNRSLDEELAVYDVHYKYELHLDDALNVVGGVWHSQSRPDFLWMADASATNENNNFWNATSKLDDNLVALAVRRAKKRLILGELIGGLAQKAQFTQ